MYFRFLFHNFRLAKAVWVIHYIYFPQQFELETQSDFCRHYMILIHTNTLCTVMITQNQYNWLVLTFPISCRNRLNDNYSLRYKSIGYHQPLWGLSIYGPDCQSTESWSRQILWLWILFSPGPCNQQQKRIFFLFNHFNASVVCDFLCIKQKKCNAHLDIPKSWNPIPI